MKNPNLEISKNGRIRIHVPMQLKHKEGRKVIIAPKALDGDIPGAPVSEQEAILRAIAMSWEWVELLESGKVESVTELSEKMKFSWSYTKRILSLVNLAPKVVEAIVYGREPDGLSLQKLVTGFPDDWDEQWKMLGFETKEPAFLPETT
jgi:hypothetical protein